MAATLYTGDGTSTKSFSNAVNGVSFQPDLVWSRIRSGTTQGTGVFDSIRGTTGQSLDTADQTVQGTWNGANASDYGYVSAFNTDGFSVNDGAIATTGGYVNYSGRTYVAWQWKASGSSVSNTSGSITSTVSANTTAGFSIVRYGAGTGATATVGHGLGVAPSMIIIKGTNLSSWDWSVYHTSIGNTAAFALNTTAAPSTSSAFWNNTSPTSSVFTVGTSATVNASTYTYVAYCFAAVAGYSAFGSYTGNGSTDGTFVYLGFRPRWVMFKRIDTTESWVQVDSSRDPYNVVANYILINTTGVEANGVSYDFVSNGIKFRGTSQNVSGATYSYAAFAENPFKYANAR
jgi:hypothetical protein